MDVKLVRSNEEDKLRQLIASAAFARQKIFDHNLAALHMHKSRLVLNRPVYKGQCVFDLSKLLMYDFYYNTLKKQYGEKCSLLYTDTDSLLLEIQTEDVYKDMAASADLYDTSDYPQDHPLHSTTNKKVLGKMKDATIMPRGTDAIIPILESADAMPAEEINPDKTPVPTAKQ